MPSLYLIDGHAYIHRAYHALPPMNNSRGEPVNAVYGFVRMLLKIIKQEKPDHLIVCFDTAAPTFRHKAFAEYKATRKEIDDSLISQFPMARDAAKALSLAVCELDGFEADDLIAHLTRQGEKQGWNVVIVSADKDTLQLVNDNVKVLSEPKNVLYDSAKVQERYGLPPKTLPDYFALIGDASDNVPGVPGIGPKTAAKLLQEYGDLESLLKAAPTLKGKTGTILQENIQAARESRALVTLEGQVPLQINWKDAVLRPPQMETLAPFLKRMEFFSMLDEILPQSAAPTTKTMSEDYLAILTEEALQKWVNEAKGELRLSIEVITSLGDPLRSELLGLSLSFKAGSARYIPLRAGGLGTGPSLSLPVVQKYLQEVFDGKSPQLYGHNLKQVVLVLERYGFHLGPLHCDTMVASYVLNPSRSNHWLKDVVLEILGERMDGIEQIVGKGAQQIRMDQVPLDKLVAYACAQSDMALRVADVLEKQIKEKQLEKVFYVLEMPLINVLAEMEKCGIRMDRAYLDELGLTLKQRAETLEKKIYEQAGETFNINSPKQLSTILFEKLKLPVVRRTKTGFSTDEEVLLTLSSSHALPAALIEFRELQKMRSTYIEGLQTGMLPGEDRVHTNFNQTVAATGRLSSSNPNLQNIPIRTELGRQIRKAFVADSGNVLLSADYSQIDLRVLAHISQDKVLIQAFKSGEDIHTATACEVFGVTPKTLTQDQRRAAKSINFGIVYGMSAFGLSQQLQISAEEAKNYIDRYFQRYMGVKTWIEHILEEARKNGYVKTLLGRIRYLPEIQSKNSAVRGFAERTAMNTPIQGTSADIIKLAMLNLDHTHVNLNPLPSPPLDSGGRANDLVARRERVAKPGEGWSGRMLIQVHDELLFELPPAEIPTSGKRIKELMEKALPLAVPVVVDLKAGPNWAEMTVVP